MKKALVTGGSGAIGNAICLQLASQDHHVIVHANTQLAKAEKVVQTIQAAGGSAQAIQFDITQTQQCADDLIAFVDPDPIQIIVHCAGVHDDAPLAGMSEQQWKQVIDVSLHGFYNVVKPLLLPMMRTRWGRIVAISSISGVMGNRGQANYAAAKAGLHGACRSLGMEVASRGITANVVAPGMITSPMLDKSPINDAMIKQMIPMKRLGKPEEVAALVGFLTSNDASYICGQVISVNGGMA